MQKISKNFILKKNNGKIEYLNFYQYVEEIYKIIKYIKENYPNKKIWLYTGETINEKYFIEESNNLLIKTVKECDIVIDGPYINELRDLRLKFRGSSNQRIIDIKESLKQKKIILLD